MKATWKDWLLMAAVIVAWIALSIIFMNGDPP
jgi:hypothetical protein